MEKATFKQWCEKYNRYDLIDRWDYELNGNTPDEVFKCENKMIYLKCPRGIHESVSYNIKGIQGRGRLYCKRCKSFAQYMIDEYGEEYLNNIWSDRNEGTPWDYYRGDTNKAWFVCLDNPNHIYQQRIVNKSNGCGCSICNNNNPKTGVAKEKSLGILYPESVFVWSDKNDTTPYEYSPASDKEVWWKCENNKHDDFKRRVRGSRDQHFECPTCAKEKRVWPKGSDHPNWKGTATKGELARSSKEGKDWKRSVFKRDGFLCQICLDSTHDRLNVHHIYDFASYPELRYDIRNGVLLCEQCHLNHYKGSLHSTYGNANVTPEQLQEYANKRRAELGITEPFDINKYTNGLDPTTLPYPEELPPDLDSTINIA